MLDVILKYGLIILASAGLAWSVQDARYSAKISTINEATAKANEKTAAAALKEKNELTLQRTQLEQQIASDTLKHMQELADEKKRTDDLAACVASGKCGLRVNATCSAKPTGSKDNVPDTAAAAAAAIYAGPELTADARQNYFSLRGGIAEITSTLAQCRSYVDQIQKIQGVPEPAK